jgi:5-methyltetrahydrofolate--homocysteine methyltransferase
MTRALLKDRLQQGLFFVDGAMGTQLIEAGAPAGCCNEFLCIETPQIIQTVHQQYIDTGVDAIITNTFGANGIVLKRHGHENEVYAVNLAAARLAREVAGPEKYVLGGLGPCGDFLQPLGTITADGLTAAFIEQAKGLAEGDVDGFIIETMTASDEVKIAIETIQSISQLPILVSLAYDPTGDEARTMMGMTPAQAAEQLAPLGIAALGFNCGTLDMDGYVRLAQDYTATLQGTDVLLLAEPNAGRPELEGSRTVYRLSPNDFAQSLVRINEAGAVILGGCCGTSPAHLEAAVKALRH